MLERRCAGVYAGLIAAMMGLVLRLYILSQSAYYAAVAGGQSSWLLEVDTSRGQIYDCELQPLVSTEMAYLAAVEPSAQAAAALYSALAPEQREAVTRHLAGLTRWRLQRSMRRGWRYFRCPSAVPKTRRRCI